MEKRDLPVVAAAIVNTTGGGYENAKAELQKVLSLDPQNQEANALLERLEDIIAITSEIK